MIAGMSVATYPNSLPADWPSALFREPRDRNLDGWANAGGARRFKHPLPLRRYRRRQATNGPSAETIGGTYAPYLCCRGGHALGGGSARANSNYDFPGGNNYRHQRQTDCRLPYLGGEPGFGRHLFGSYERERELQH